MLEHPIVDVALGLILLYTVLSLFASVVKEWISTFLSLRAKNLRKGIQTLIGADYAAKLYGHPLVSTLATEKKLPSYIGSGTFAAALVDLLVHGDDDQSTEDTEDDQSTEDAEEKAAQFIRKVSGDPELGRALRALSSTGVETVAELRTEIATWFDDGMNRVSGWYRRQTQWIIFAIGAGVTLFANASTVHVAADLWRDDMLRYSVAQQAVSMASPTPSPDSLQASEALLASFPVGWEDEDPLGVREGVPDWTSGTWFAHLMGWILTAAAVSLGAPFWFDLLGRVAKLRGTGKRPGGGRGIGGRPLRGISLYRLITLVSVRSRAQEVS